MHGNTEFGSTGRNPANEKEMLVFEFGLEVPVLRVPQDRVRVSSQPCPPSLAGFAPEPPERRAVRFSGASFLSTARQGQYWYQAMTATGGSMGAVCAVVLHVRPSSSGNGK